MAKEVTYVKKVEQISEEDREIVRASLSEIAESIRGKYPDLTFEDLRQFLREMISVTI